MENTFDYTKDNDLDDDSEEEDPLDEDKLHTKLAEDKQMN